MKATVRLRIIFSLLILLFLFSTSALAQQYNFEVGGNNAFTSPQKILQPQNLRHIYGLLTVGEDKVDYYTFELDKAIANMQISLLINDKNENASFKPSLLFIDPRVKTMQGEPPFGFPRNLGGTVYSWPQGKSKLFRDEVIIETYREGPKLSKSLPEGKYVIAVFDPEGKGGRYVLLVGGQKPKETIADKFASLWAFVRIKLNIY